MLQRRARARHLSWLSGVFKAGKMPLLKLMLADNGVSVRQGVLPAGAAGGRAAGARPLEQPDLRRRGGDGGRPRRVRHELHRGGEWLQLGDGADGAAAGAS